MKKQVNMRLINKNTPIDVGMAHEKPFIAFGIDQTWNKKSKAKYVGLWIEDQETVEKLSKIFEAARLSFLTKPEVSSEMFYVMAQTLKTVPIVILLQLCVKPSKSWTSIKERRNEKTF